MVIEFLLVFDDLDAEENAAEGKRRNQETRDQRLLARLRRPDGHGHGQTAHNKYGCVKSTQLDVQSVAANPEGGEEIVAIDRVGKEHSAEEQNLGDQKDPHAQGGGFLLLFQSLKLAVKFSGAMHAALLFWRAKARPLQNLRAPPQGPPSIAFRTIEDRLKPVLANRRRGPGPTGLLRPGLGPGDSGNRKAPNPLPA